MGRYDDIIDLPHHVSNSRKPMPLEARAAQFAPFAALTGHDAAINETARLTSERIDLNPDEQRILSERLAIAIGRMDGATELRFTVFVEDTLKSGGKYIDKTGIIKKFNEYDRQIILNDNTAIRIDDIMSISGSIFE